MSSFVVLSGDTVNFETAFGEATLGPPPPSTTISGTGAKLTSGASVCVEGDEAKVTLSGVSYMTSECPAPGVGDLTIKQLNSDQLAQKLTVGGKKAILVGSKFDATFTVKTPATDPSTSKPDQAMSYSGKGSFSTSDTKLDIA
jgi:contractile injection system spike tip protein